MPTSSTYIAILRGINVSGKNLIKMAALKKSLDGLKLKRLRTYVQSGNLVFEASDVTADALSKKITTRIRRDFDCQVPVIVKTVGELEKLVRNNPFLKEKGIDPKTLHVTFLAEAPVKSTLKNLDRLPLKPDRFILKGTELYIHCPDGYGKTKLSNTAFERLLTVVATTRNWNTVNKLLAMASG